MKVVAQTTALRGFAMVAFCVPSTVALTLVTRSVAGTLWFVTTVLTTREVTLPAAIRTIAQTIVLAAGLYRTKVAVMVRL